MEDLIFEKLENDNLQYVVFSISEESPLFYLDELKELIDIEEGSMIVFDQLLQTGDVDNRFLCLKYSNGTFDFSSIKHLSKKDVGENVYSVISNYLRKNRLLLRYSILLEEQKEKIIKGGNL